MKSQGPIGLDELMIVNPGTPGKAQPGNPVFFLGEDGELYQVQGLQGGEAQVELAEYFLGDDGNLYHVPGLGALIVSTGGLEGGRVSPRFFLGDDGTLYEITK